MKQWVPNSLVQQFLGRCTLYAVLWYVGYELLLKPQHQLDAFLSTNLAQAGAALLRGVGVAASVPAQQVVAIAGEPAVLVGDPCNGLTLYALFAGFILAFPGPHGHKLWFIPLGWLLLYGLNLLRVGLLALNHHYAHHSVEFNHHYTFTFVVYSCMVLLWLQWTKRYAATAG